MNKINPLCLIVIAILGVLGFLIFKSPAFAPTVPGDVVVCTQEAKQCSDGSYVSRTGPNCEFARCPVVSIPKSETTVSTKLGGTISLGGVTGTLTELVADSRCAIDTQCIWAGTVKVKVHFTSGGAGQDKTLTLGETLTLYGHAITLTGVKPENKSGVTIAPADYMFTFLIK